MKRKYVYFILTIIVVGVVVSATYIYAWYTYTSNIGKIDAETEDIAIAYKFNDSEEINELTYSISNLAFFDIDDPSELKFLNDMHTVIKLDIENFSSISINYTITYSCPITRTKDGETTISTAYVVGFITDSQTITITDDGTNSISTYIPENADTRESEDADFINYKSIKTGSLDTSTTKSETLYLHLLGVQEIDIASNDFLYDAEGKEVEYTFTLTLSAIDEAE